MRNPAVLAHCTYAYALMPVMMCNRASHIRDVDWAINVRPLLLPVKEATAPPDKRADRNLTFF
jgi:hypothetical protein